MLRSFASAHVSLALALVICAQLSTVVHGVETLLFIEDFDDLDGFLGPAADEAIPEDVIGWTHQTPPGWQIANFGAGFAGPLPGIDDPAEGVEEWEGWSFTTEEFWLAADGQRRSEFFIDAEGEPILRGVFAVADPDEWDDLGDPEIIGQRPCNLCGPYNTFLASAEIDIAHVTPGTMTLTFDSSWRPECDDSCQRAEVLANYDNGQSIPILEWTSDGGSPNFKDDNSTNETLSLSVPAPSSDADSVQFFFNMLDAGNDWWWAIDNISVSGDVSDVVERPCDFDDDGLCNTADINALMNEVAAGTNDSAMDLTGDSVVDDGDRDAWLAAAATENGLSQPYMLGDTNLDLHVDVSDLNNLGVSWQSNSNNWTDGNLTGAGVDAADLNVVALGWQTWHPDAPMASEAVPEPASLTLLAIAGIALALRRRR